jgi:hypothetical protein
MNNLNIDKLIKMDKLYNKYIDKLKNPLIEFLDTVQNFELDNLTILCEYYGQIEGVVLLNNGEIEDNFGYKYTIGYLHYIELSNLTYLVLKARS